MPFVHCLVIPIDVLKSNFGRKLLISAYTPILQSIIPPRKSGQEHKAGTQRQKLMQGPWKIAAYWHAPQDLLSLLPYAKPGPPF